jgi:hypothetical protein
VSAVAREVAPVTEEEFADLLRQWRASPLASFLAAHALCVGELERDATLLAWLDGGVRVWCRIHGDTLDVPDRALPSSADRFWLVMCTGVVMEHPELFSDDPSGVTLAECVNRLAVVLRRAALP